MKSKLCALLLILFSVTFGATLFAQENAAATGGDTPSELGPDEWRIEDFHPYVQALDDLKKLSKEYSEKILIKAIDEYSIGMDVLHDMDAKLVILQKRYDKQNNLNERWYWQEIDRKNQLKRQKGHIKYEAKLKAITYFTRSIHHLDEIESGEVRKDQKFIDFQVRLFKGYIAAQYDVHNLKPCIPILERYVTINEATKTDPQAYKYLASCYGYMEKALTKYKNSVSEELLFDYKHKKNQALLVATELEFGIESIEYRRLQEIVELDEKKSQRINNFK